MKVLGIIPARKNSSGIKNKNFKLINGKPLIYYTINEAKKSDLYKFYVVSDDKKIIEYCKELKINFLMRPFNISKKNSKMIEVVNYTLSNIDIDIDAFMILQPTSPLRKAKHINDSIKLLEKNKLADTVVSVISLPHNYHPAKIMTLENKYLVGSRKILQRNEIKNTFFARNGSAIYLRKLSNYSNDILGGKILPYLMNKLESIDIDDNEDFIIADSLLKLRLK
jgi:CMP-N-acetylneuraminic acid synthetase